MSRTVNSYPNRATKPYVQESAAVSATSGAATITADRKAMASMPTMTTKDIARRIVKLERVSELISSLTRSSETTL